MKKDRPTPRRNVARTRARAFGDDLRGWLHGRGIDARARRQKEAGELEVRRHSPDRGSPYRTPTVKWVHRHTGFGPHTPYVNPRRDAKSAKSGRLRRELQP